MVVHRRCTHLTDTYTLPVPVYVTWVIYPVGHTCALGWYRWYTMSPWGTHSVCGVQHVMHGVTLPVPHTDIPHYGWIPTWVHHPVDTWSWDVQHDIPRSRVDTMLGVSCTGCAASHGCTHNPNVRTCNMVSHTRSTGWYIMVEGGCTMGCRWYVGATHVTHVLTPPIPHANIPPNTRIHHMVHHPVGTWSRGDTPDPGWIPW